MSSERPVEMKNSLQQYSPTVSGKKQNKNVGNKDKKREHFVQAINTFFCLYHRGT